MLLYVVYLISKPNKMKIKNLTSPKGNVVPNQFQIEIGNKLFYKSYDSNIVKIENGRTYLDVKYWNWSKTTSKYRNLFLGETTKETERKILNGDYLLIDLNAPERTNTARDFKFLK